MQSRKNTTKGSILEGIPMRKCERLEGWLDLQTKLQDPTKTDRGDYKTTEMQRKIRRHILEIILFLQGS